MNSRFIGIFSALTLLATGCVVNNPSAYDPCKTVKDCSGPYADVCQLVTQSWSVGGTATDAICTSTICNADESCSLSANGSYGYCSLVSILGTPPSTCFERCYYSGDCSPGFTCADGKDVPGLRSGEQICVPQGTGVVSLKDAYTTCTALSQCSAGLTRCEELSPKWDNTPSTFALSVCTVACANDSVCPLSANGESGFCAQMSDISDMQVCVERCNVPADCRPGFICAPMSTVTGLPENPSDSLCLPDPKYAP